MSAVTASSEQNATLLEQVESQLAETNQSIDSISTELDTEQANVSNLTSVVTSLSTALEQLQNVVKVTPGTSVEIGLTQGSGLLVDSDGVFVVVNGDKVLQIDETTGSVDMSNVKFGNYSWVSTDSGDTLSLTYVS